MAAKLEFTVDSGSTPKAIADLDKLVQSSAEAEAAVGKMSAASKKAMQDSAAATSQMAQSSADFVRRVQANFASFNTFAAQIERSLNFRSLGGAMGGAGMFPNFAERAKDIQAYGAELDKLRAKFNPLWSAGQNYRKVVEEINAAHRVGAISTRERIDAIERERVATGRLVDQINHINQDPRRRRGRDGANDNQSLQRMMSANLMYQFQDIAVTSAMGMSPAMIALQQGTQIGASLSAMPQGTNGIRALGGALMGVLSPVNLLAIGFTAAAAGAIQFFQSADKVKTLKEHNEDYIKSVDAIAKAWNLATISAEEFTKLNVAEAISQGRMSRVELQAAQMTATGTFLGKVGQQLGGQPQVDILGNPTGQTTPGDFVAQERFKAFAGPIAELNRALDEGRDGWKAFQEQVMAIGDSGPRALKLLAAELVVATLEAKRLNEQLDKTEDLVSGKRGRIVGRGAMDAAQEQFNRAREDYFRGPRTEDAVNAWRQQLQAQAEQQQIRARLFSERLAAARMAAQADTSGSPRERADRERIAVAAELARQEMELRDAAKARSDAQRASVEQMAIEIRSIGQTAAEMMRLNEQYRLAAELREEAERTGRIISPEEIANIKRAADEMARLVELRQRASLRQELTEEREGLLMNRDDAMITARMRRAGLNPDLNSWEARQMRANQRIEELRGYGETFWDEFQDGLMRGEDFGKSFGNALKAAAIEALTDFNRRIFDDLITEFMKVLTGESGGGVGSKTEGVLGEWLGNLLGVRTGGAPALASPVPSGTGATRIGGGVGAVADTAGALLGGGGGALEYRTGFNSNVNRGLLQALEAAALNSPEYRAVAISGRAGRASGTPNHPGGHAVDVQLYDRATGRALDNYQNPATFRAYEKFGQRAYAAMAESNPELLKNFRFGGYFGGRYGHDQMHYDVTPSMRGSTSLGSWRTGLDESLAANRGYIGQSTGLDELNRATDRAAQGIDDMTTQAISASNGLGGLGQGLSQLANSLMQQGGGAGGGGWFSSLMNLFGGATGATNYMMGISPAATQAIAGGFGGLYHSGGIAGQASLHRRVDPSVFFGAPRYHAGTLGAGLSADEVPAILRRGEVVSKSPAHARAQFGGRGQIVNIQPPAGYRAEKEQDEDEEGNERLNVTFSKMAASEAKRRGSPFNKQLRTMGAQLPRVRR